LYTSVSSVKLRHNLFTSDTSWFEIIQQPTYHMKVQSMCWKRRLINYKSKGEDVPVHVMKKYEGMEV